MRVGEKIQDKAISSTGGDVVSEGRAAVAGKVGLVSAERIALIDAAIYLRLNHPLVVI